MARVALAAVSLVTACYPALPPPTSQWAGPRALAALPPYLPPPPAHRGELDLSTSLRGHSYLGTPQAGARASGAGYATIGSAEGALGYRASRVFEIRALGSLGLGPGAVDAYGVSGGVGASWPTRLGLGAVLGFASDSEPFQVQLTADAGIVGVANSALIQHEVRTCTQITPGSWPEWSCTPWMATSPRGLELGITVRPYIRATVVVGIDVSPSVRLFAQGGMVFGPFPDDWGDVDYNAVLALDASAEWYVDDNTSLLLSVGWATFDPFFTHGPSGSLGIRSVLPDTGPGSVRRSEERRVRVIARAWNRARSDAGAPRFSVPPHPPRSMLRSRMPVPDWMWSILGASDVWELVPPPPPPPPPDAQAPSSPAASPAGASATP